jgi:excisionase family DNA binding protein
MNSAKVEELKAIAQQTASSIAGEAMSFVCQAYSIFKDDILNSKPEKVLTQSANEREGDKFVPLPSRRFLTAEQLAELLQVKPKSIYHWAEIGKIPSHKFGESLRFDLKEVLEATRNETQLLMTETKPTLNKSYLKAVK